MSDDPGSGISTGWIAGIVAVAAAAGVFFTKTIPLFIEFLRTREQARQNLQKEEHADQYFLRDRLKIMLDGQTERAEVDRSAIEHLNRELMKTLLELDRVNKLLLEAKSNERDLNWVISRLELDRYRDHRKPEA